MKISIGRRRRSGNDHLALAGKFDFKHRFAQLVHLVFSSKLSLRDFTLDYSLRITAGNDFKLLVSNFYRVELVVPKV